MSVERERELENRVVKEGWEGLFSPETGKLERTGKVQNCVGRLCSFPPFVCFCFDHLPLWPHHPLLC